MSRGVLLPLVVVFALLGLGGAGCAAGSNEEADAARALAPKPPTESERRAQESVKAAFPGATSASHAGAGR